MEFFPPFIAVHPNGGIVPPLLTFHLNGGIGPPWGGSHSTIFIYSVANGALNNKLNMDLHKLEAALLATIRYIHLLRILDVDICHHYQFDWCLSYSCPV